MSNLGLKNNNPGNLRDPKTGAFQVFNSADEGQQALINDINIKQSGKSSHIKPGASILDLAKVWAPASDHNVPTNWANNVAKTVGVPSTYAFDKIPADKLAEGIKAAEGTSTMPTHQMVSDEIPLINNANAQTNKMSLQQFGETIQKKYPQYAGKDATLVAQKVLSKYPQYASKVDSGSDMTGQYQSQDNSQPDQNQQSYYPQGFDNPVGQMSIGAAKGILGGSLPNLGLQFADQTVGRLGNLIAGKGFNPTNTAEQTANNPVSKELNAPSKSGWETTGNIIGHAGLIAGAGLGSGLFAGGTKETGALGSDVIKNMISSDLGPEESLGSLDSIDKADILGNIYKTASVGEKPLIEQALKELSQKILVENGVKMGLLKSTLKYLSSHPVLSVVGFERLEPMAQNFLKGLYDKYIGNQIGSPDSNNSRTITAAP